MIKDYDEIMIDLDILQLKKEIKELDTILTISRFKNRCVEQAHPKKIRGMQPEDFKYLEYDENGKLMNFIASNRASDFREK